MGFFDFKRPPDDDRLLKIPYGQNFHSRFTNFEPVSDISPENVKTKINLVVEYEFLI